MWLSNLRSNRAEAAAKILASPIVWPSRPSRLPNARKWAASSAGGEPASTAGRRGEIKWAGNRPSCVAEIAGNNSYRLELKCRRQTGALISYRAASIILRRLRARRPRLRNKRAAETTTGRPELAREYQKPGETAEAR